MEHNWSLCAAYILHTHRNPSAQTPSASDLLAQLLQGSVTPHCIEVVSAVNEEVQLPTDFVRALVAHLLNCCERCADKAAQVLVL